jgi:heme-degrading protein
VAVAKARNAFYFSSREGYEVLRRYVDTNPYDDYEWEPQPPAGQGWALTNRTLSFGGQPLFPPGIDLEKDPTPGPWFALFAYDSANPCTEGPGLSRGGNRAYLNQSGIVWFAGSAPLYKEGRLVGGLGVSGDGVEQDDFVSFGAAQGFEPPDELRVDHSVIRTGAGDTVRLPYWKFPRNPEQP